MAGRTVAVFGTGARFRSSCRSARAGGLTLAQAFEVADATFRAASARGDAPRGYKIGFTNRTIWLRYGVRADLGAGVAQHADAAEGSEATVSLAAGAAAPEPEIVFGFVAPPRAGMPDAEPFACIEWVARLREIVHT